MGVEGRLSESFFCACCDRDLPIRSLAPSRLATPNGLLHRVCKQCESFLVEGLPFLTQRIAERKLRLVDPEAVGLSTTSGKGGLKTPRDESPPASTERKTARPRAASAMEKDLFHFHSLSVELYIEGFIKGLEAAGVDRGSMSREAETAVNNLLHISQTLAGERRRVQTDACNRSDIRRLGRHIDDTSLMVNEYVRAVTEECLEPRRASRYISSHGRDPVEQIGADATE